MRELQIKVDILPLQLSQSSVRFLERVDTYDHVVFTSKNAERLFLQEMRKLHIKVPKEKVVRVGPTAELLKLPLTGKRVLFPRSLLAPFNIVRALRDRGVVVRTIPFYTARGKKLSSRQRNALLSGEIDRLYFKSPSGIVGLLAQLTQNERDTALKIPALCIGATTAEAAQKAGWKKVSKKR